MIDRSTLRPAGLAGLLALALTAAAAAAPQAPAATPPPNPASPSAGPATPAIAAKPCEADAAYHRLDFWHGHWDVFADGKKDGSDYVEPIVGGCALIEHWSDADGSEGKSLFYFSPKTKKWKQVWVTDAGPVKEKEEVDPPTPGAMRFSGVGYRSNGTTIPDRTTLTPLSGDRVRQVIEISRDDGKTWTVVYDATYERPKGAAK